MHKKLTRLLSIAIIYTGLFLFFRIVYSAITGSLVGEFFDQPQTIVDSSFYSLVSLFLSLPVPLHVISIGFILKRKSLPPVLAKLTWLVIVISGCWLGISIWIRMFVLN